MKLPKKRTKENVLRKYEDKKQLRNIETEDTITYLGEIFKKCEKRHLSSDEKKKIGNYLTDDEKENALVIGIHIEDSETLLISRNSIRDILELRK